jgi:predicted Zn-dependent peptidase
MECLTLDNGLRIYFDPRPYLRSCALGLYVGSGSRFETPQTLGVSHCIEHMLFKGTDELSALDVAEITDDTGGTLNAYTTKEYTCVYARVLTEQIETILSLISDITLRPALREDELETEKDVISEEKDSYEDSSEDLCMDCFYESFWPDDMLGQNIVGTAETIRSFSVEMIRGHMARFYVPERMVLVFSGAFDREDVLRQCRAHFGSLRNTGNPLRCTAPTPARFIRCVPKDVQQNILTLGLPGLPLDDPRLPSCSYACSILGGAGSSRLFQRIREEMGLVYSIDAFHAGFLGAGALCITMGLSARKQTRALREVLRLCREFPETLTQRELDRAKMQAIASVSMSLESPASSAARIGRNALLRGKVMTEEELLCRLRSVTLDEVRDVARDLLRRDRFSLCVVGKTDSEDAYRAVLDEG